MPHLSGRELAETVRHIRPEGPVLFMSGYTDDDILRRGVIGRRGRVPPEAVHRPAMATKVREVLDTGRRRTIPRGSAASVPRFSLPPAFPPRRHPSRSLDQTRHDDTYTPALAAALAPVALGAQLVAVETRHRRPRRSQLHLLRSRALPPRGSAPRVDPRLQRRQVNTQFALQERVLLAIADAARDRVRVEEIGDDGRAPDACGSVS